MARKSSKSKISASSPPASTTNSITLSPTDIWLGRGLPFVLAAVALALYVVTLAPGLTWANYGADGGDLLAAAVQNGVPHPTGYPLYTILLQIWLKLVGLLAPNSEIAWRGNLFSAVAGAASVGFTCRVAYQLIKTDFQRPWLWAGMVGLAWGATPLLWNQSIITEVYALHALLIAFHGWVLLTYYPLQSWRRPVLLGLSIGLGLAHHVTFALLMLATLYWIWSEPDRTGRRFRFWWLLGLGALLPLLFYLRIPLVAHLGETPPPVDWGYPYNLQGLWWLVSGAAYRRYLFSVPLSGLLSRVSTWALTVSVQYTPLGLALSLIGLSLIDQYLPRLRNWGLLWVLPISIYTIGYNTFDSEIYLLAVGWMLAIWLAYGLPAFTEWLGSRWPDVRPRMDHAFLVMMIAGLLALVAVRLPRYSLRHDTEAQEFVDGALQALEPNSLVFSSGDAETFALWYSAWATGELIERAPGAMLVNVALYQFDWYRELLQDLYPNLPGVSESPSSILAQNSGTRPIFFSEKLPLAPVETLQPVGSIWRFVPPAP